MNSRAKSDVEPDTTENLREKIDTWVAQAYTNGNLDTHVQPFEAQGYMTCTELIMEAIKQHDKYVIGSKTATAYNELIGETNSDRIRNQLIDEQWQRAEASYGTDKEEV